jgi:hypothetical protein
MLLNRRGIVALAFATLFISSVEISHAQPLTPDRLELLVADSNEALRVSVPGDLEPTWPTLIEMSDRSLVMAWDMLLVSVMIQKVERARTAKGARKVGAEIAKESYGWGSYQFSCLDALWTKESNWNYRARNPRTGAHGIPQALPATKMEVVGTDWRTNPVTQIQWGLRYIDIRYETPCKAWAKFKRSRYY